MHPVGSAVRHNLWCVKLETGTRFKVLSHRLTYHRVKARGRGPGSRNCAQVQASRRARQQS